MNEKICYPGPTGDLVCSDPLLCEKPKQWICSPNGVQSCRCEQVFTQDPGKLCTASIVYGVNTPANPYLVPMEAHCDAAGLELAVAVMLSRLLGAPR